MTGSNTLVYHGTELITVVKGFIVEELVLGSRENVQGYFRRLPSTSVFGFNTSKHAETGS